MTTTSLEQIIQFLNNLSYITYVGIQYWEKIVRMQSYGVGNKKNQ